MYVQVAKREISRFLYVNIITKMLINSNLSDIILIRR